MSLIYYVCVSVCVYSYTPWGLSTHAKEFSGAGRMMESSSKELSTLVPNRV